MQYFRYINGGAKLKKAIFYYFPYAGASAMSFKNMHGYFSDDVQTVCVEYSGHGKRIESPYPVSINDIATDAFKTITATDNEVPVYLGGHCLGAIVAYEVCLLFKKAGISAPAKLFISGQGAPDKIISEKLQTMNEEEGEFAVAIEDGTSGCIITVRWWLLLVNDTFML